MRLDGYKYPLVGLTFVVLVKWSVLCVIHVLCLRVILQF